MAKDSVNDLYFKYINRVGKTLEEDAYFQYLFKMIQDGSTVLQQRHQTLHKVVDERWLTTIEEALEALNKIISKPRRFITTEEELVPASLARKITGDSVRHLAQNTQFITSTENGEIQPSRILNVTTKETYDLYENRFIYHLIQRLVVFIDKRTDVIFWSVGDETRNVLTVENKTQDAYEEIEYKLEMTVKDRRNFAENNADTMTTFIRIDRVRRMVMALKNSQFCTIMNGCERVKSPIQRTNLLIKDPQYKKCYQLWQFLERYDEVGYTIEVKDHVLEFDVEYLNQMYTNLITNYAVFKSVIQDDTRNIDEVRPSRHKVIKPKFVKQIKEEIVKDYDINEVEVRKVFVEEVTEAQIKAENDLKEEIKLREKAEQKMEEAIRDMIRSRDQAKIFENEKENALTQAAEAEEAKLKAISVAEEAKKECELARKNESLAIQECNIATNERDEAITLKNQAIEQKNIAIIERDEAIKNESIATDEKNKANAQREEAIKEKDTALKEATQKVEAAEYAFLRATELEKHAKELNEKANELVETAKADEVIAANEKEEAQKLLKSSEQVRNDAEHLKMESINIKRDAEREIAEIKAKTEEQIRKANQAAQRRIDDMYKKAEEKLAQAKEIKKNAERLSSQAKKDMLAAKHIKDESEKKIRSAEKARDVAQRKADSDSLGKYIVRALKNNKENKD